MSAEKRMHDGGREPGNPGEHEILTLQRAGSGKAAQQGRSRTLGQADGGSGERVWATEEQPGTPGIPAIPASLLGKSKPEVGWLSLVHNLLKKHVVDQNSKAPAPG
ncbi:hypothetical protein AMS62_00060 [Bacillus sp. FJAT-18019]|nr:hypothetical protein AMS62_00060 [Bacillus sp. FJAT-18019]